MTPESEAMWAIHEELRNLQASVLTLASLQPASIATQRERIATAALAAIISKFPPCSSNSEFQERYGCVPHTSEEKDSVMQQIALSAVQYADELIRQLTKPQEEKSGESLDKPES